MESWVFIAEPQALFLYKPQTAYTFHTPDQAEVLKIPVVNHM